MMKMTVDNLLNDIIKVSLFLFHQFKLVFVKLAYAEVQLNEIGYIGHYRFLLHFC